MGDSPGRNNGVGCHALLQGIFPTKESNLNLSLLHCRRILYLLSHQGPQPTTEEPALGLGSLSWILSGVRQRQIKILGVGTDWQFSTARIALVSSRESNSKTTSTAVNPQDGHLGGSPTPWGPVPTLWFSGCWPGWGWALPLSGLGPQIFTSLSIIYHLLCPGYLLQELLDELNETICIKSSGLDLLIKMLSLPDQMNFKPLTIL